MGDKIPPPSSSLGQLSSTSAGQNREIKAQTAADARRPSLSADGMVPVSQDLLQQLLQRMNAIESGSSARRTPAASTPSSGDSAAAGSSEAPTSEPARRATPSVSSARAGASRGLVSQLQHRFDTPAPSAVRFRVPDVDDDSEEDRDQNLPDTAPEVKDALVQGAIRRARTIGSFTMWVKAQSHLDRRTQREAASLAQVIDFLLSGRTADALDAAVRRIVASTTASKYHNWGIADVLQSESPADSLLPDEFKAEVFKQVSAVSASRTVARLLDAGVEIVESTSSVAATPSATTTVNAALLLVDLTSVRAPLGPIATASAAALRTARLRHRATLPLPLPLISAPARATTAPGRGMNELLGVGATTTSRYPFSTPHS